MLINRDFWPVKALSLRNFSCNLQRYSTLERCKIGKYVSLLDFTNVLFTYNTIHYLTSLNHLSLKIFLLCIVLLFLLWFVFCSFVFMVSNTGWVKKNWHLSNSNLLGTYRWNLTIPISRTITMPFTSHRELNLCLRLINRSFIWYALYTLQIFR